MRTLIFISLILLSGSCTETTPVRKAFLPLKEYVMAEDIAFEYTVVDSVLGENWKEYKIRMQSGTWLTPRELEPIMWWHWLNVIIPDDVRETESMMIIGGGDSNDPGKLPSDDWWIRAAVGTGSIITHVSNIPFQPIDYKGDQKGNRWEDDLIAFGWREFLESGASDTHLKWLARLPMTRAVTRAMDVVEEISAREQSPVRQRSPRVIFGTSCCL